MSDDGNVITITHQIRHRRAVEAYARLLGLAERKYEEVRANPDPFLQQAYLLIAAYERKLAEIQTTIWPPPGTPFDLGRGIGPPYSEAMRILGDLRSINLTVSPPQFDDHPRPGA